MVLVLCGLMHGRDRDKVLSPNWEPLSVLRAAEPLHPAVDEVALGSFRQRQLPQIVGFRYVVRSLEAALWAFHDAADFREAVLRVVKPARRRRHDRRRLRAVFRGLLGRIGDSGRLAGRTCPSRHD